MPDQQPAHCTCGHEDSDGRGDVLACKVHCIGPTPCPYCEGEGCSECSGTGERYATYVSAGDGLSAVIHGNVPLNDEVADAIVAVMRAAYDLMTKDSPNA